MGSQKNVIIITGSSPALKTISHVFRQNSPAQWCYCGTDVPFSLELEAALGENTRVPLGKILQETAHEFRQEYIDFIGRISRSNAGNPRIDGWWLSSVSEKNPFISRVFLYFCYVKICQGLPGTVPGDILIISESRALSDSLSDNLKSLDNCRVSRADPERQDLSEMIGSVLGPALRKLWFFWAYGSRILTARLFRMLCSRHRSRLNKPPEICIHSFTDHRSLTDPGQYRHIYFGGLGPALEKSGIPFFYLVDVLPTAPYLSAMHRLLRYPEDCRLLEEFIAFSDLAGAYRFVSGAGKWWVSGIAMAGVRMGQILDGEQERDRTNTRREEAYLRSCAGRRIASGFRIRTFVSTFENHVWETMFRQAFRKFSPRTRLVGYAHSIVNTMYTCYSVSASERDLLPLPDVIAVNGIRAKNVLEHSGFAGTTIVIAGALRYQHLEKKKFLPRGHKEKLVLVALSAGLNDSLELTHSVIAALGDREGFSVILKCHPTLPFSIISRYLRTLPGNVHVRGDPVEKLLAEADVLLFAESTVCVEALALGVPPVNVKSTLRIDMNIFEGIGALPSVSGPAEIREAIHDVTSDEALERLNELQDIVEEFFAPVDRDFPEIFTGTKNPG